MFEKKCRLFYVRTYNFTSDKTGEVIKGANCGYTWPDPIEKEQEKGYKFSTGKLPYDKTVKLMDLKFPVDIVGSFEITSNNELKLVDIVDVLSK